MKIAIVTHSIIPSRGTERAVVNLANMLDSKHKIWIVSIAGRDNAQPHYVINESVNIVYLNMVDLPTKMISKFKWFGETYRLLKQNLSIISPDLIISVGHNINSLTILAKNNRVKIIGCEHIEYKTIPLISRILMRLTYPFLNALVVLADSYKQAMFGLNRNIHVIPNVLPFYVEKAVDLVNSRIIMVGGLTQEKGYERLIPIVQQLSKQYTGWHVDIFGSGYLHQKLIKSFQQAKVSDYITIHNPVKNIQDEYIKSSILLLTSYTEAMPMVILEAQACGLPVVAYRTTGTELLIEDENNGFLFRDDQTDEMINKLSKLMNDQQFRLKIGQNARVNSNKYDKKNICKKWDELIHAIAGKLSNE